MYACKKNPTKSKKRNPQKTVSFSKFFRTDLILEYTDPIVYIVLCQKEEKCQTVKVINRFEIID